MNTFRSYVSMLIDPACKDENKLKAAQALSEDLEVRGYSVATCLLHFIFIWICMSKAWFYIFLY